MIGRTAILGIMLFAIFCLQPERCAGQSLAKSIEEAWKGHFANISALGHIQIREQSPVHGIIDSQHIRMVGQRLNVTRSERYPNAVFGENNNYLFHLTRPRSVDDKKSDIWELKEVISKTLDMNWEHSRVAQRLGDRNKNRLRDMLFSVGPSLTVYCPDILIGGDSENRYFNLQIIPSSEIESADAMLKFDSFPKKSTPNIPQVTCHYEVTLSRQFNFLPLLCRCEIIDQSKTKSISTIEYHDYQPIGETVLPARICQYARTGEGRELTSEILVRFVAMEHESDAEFTLSAFGLDEPDFTKRPNSFSWWWLAGVLGVIFVGLLYRFMSQRR